MVIAMEMTEIDGSSVDGLSVGGNTSLDTILQHSNKCDSEDSVSDTSNLRQSANKDIVLSADIIVKETVKYSHTKTLCRIALLICVIIIVIGVMQIPIIVYATSSSDGMTNVLLDLVDFKSCSVNLEIQEMMSYDMIIGICQSHMNYSIEVLGGCNDVQASAVTALAYVYGLGVMLDSRSCVEDGISFFCNSIAVLCDTVNGSSMLTEECVKIRDSDCAVEWRIVGNLLPNVSIPDCSSFDDGTNLTFSAGPPPQTCPNDLDLFCDTFCLPVCGEASPYGDDITDFHDVWIIVMFALSVVGTIVAFIAFYLKRETM